MGRQCSYQAWELDSNCIPGACGGSMFWNRKGYSGPHLLARMVVPARNRYIGIAGSCQRDRPSMAFALPVRPSQGGHLEGPLQFAARSTPVVAAAYTHSRG